MNSPTSRPYARRVFGLSTLASHSAAAGTSASCRNSAAEISRRSTSPRTVSPVDVGGGTAGCSSGESMPHITTDNVFYQ